MYQSSSGGKQYVPLETNLGFIGVNTPRYAKLLAWKYAHMPSAQVAEDLAQNHCRAVSRSHVQAVSYAVGDILLAKESEMHYSTEVDCQEVFAISLGRDGAMLKLLDGTYREAMVGTISLLNQDREPLQTIYLADGPEYGKAGFDALFTYEITQIKQDFSALPWAAVADGAAHNWSFLENYAETSIIDWWHAWQYIHPALQALYPNEKDYAQACQKWEDVLQKQENSITKLLAKFKKAKKQFLKTQKNPMVLEKAISYLANHQAKMNYALYLQMGLQIGSGVTESACKTIIKNRFGGCGMRWEEGNTRALTLLRSLVLTKGRWEQAWKFLYPRDN